MGVVLGRENVMCQRYGDDWEHGRLKQVEQLSVAEVGKVKSYMLGDWRDQQVKKAEKL